MKKYRLAFDPWGLLLFMLLMLPNLIWFAVPAPNDVLRRESVTPILDGTAAVCQPLFAAALCLVVNRERGRLRLSLLVQGCIACGLFYYLGWGLYYRGIVYPAVILLLTLPPCLSFFSYALDRKNYIAVIPIAVFTACHLMHSIVNFILQEALL